VKLEQVSAPFSLGLRKQIANTFDSSEGQHSRDKSSRSILTNASPNSYCVCDIVTNSDSDSNRCPWWFSCSQKVEYSLAMVDFLLGPARHGTDALFSILAASSMPDFLT
jgi:hypothetical protein